MGTNGFGGPQRMSELLSEICKDSVVTAVGHDMQ